MADDVVDIVLQLGSAHFEFFDFLVGREIDILFDTVDLIVKPVIFFENASEMLIGALQAANDFAVFGEFSQDRMMKVHGDNVLVWHYDLVCLFAKRWGRMK
jgi:hypothetical protein